MPLVQRVNSNLIFVVPIKICFFCALLRNTLRLNRFFFFRTRRETTDFQGIWV